MARRGRYGIYKPIILKNNVATAYTMIASTGSYTLTGQNVNLKVGKVLVAGTGSYTLTGGNINLRQGKTLTGDTGYYILTGNDVVLTYTPFNPPPPPPPETVAANGQFVGVGKVPERKVGSWEEQQEYKRRIVEEENLVINFVKTFCEQCL